MLFDVQGALADILAAHAATPATSATLGGRVAEVAIVAAAHATQSAVPFRNDGKAGAHAEPMPEAFPCAGKPSPAAGSDSLPFPNAGKHRPHVAAGEPAGGLSLNAVKSSAAGPTDPAFPYGFAPNGNPRTWTGRVVSLDDWRRLSAWERHGSTGQHWNGITRQWEPAGSVP